VFKQQQNAKDTKNEKKTKQTRKIKSFMSKLIKIKIKIKNVMAKTPPVEKEDCLITSSGSNHFSGSWIKDSS